MNMPNEKRSGNFEAKVVDTVKTVLIEIFEAKSAETTFRILRESYGLEGKDIPKRPHIFSQALVSLFGKGAVIIEDLILEKLYTACKREFNWKESYQFSNYIEDLTQTPTFA
ncbi:MAG: hypothetical protein ACXADB_08460 [Candidatus Hermodarchaeia archaeon]|jgi:hypothetical protein